VVLLVTLLVTDTLAKGVTNNTGVPFPCLPTRLSKPQNPKKKTKKYSDSGGLFLQVSPSGGKWWRLAYRYQQKQKLLSLGVYPEVSLAQARARRDEARRLLAEGIDPSAHRKISVDLVEEDVETFERVGREWFAKFSPGWVPSHADRILRRLEKDVFPWIGDRPIAEITAPEVLMVLRRMEDRGVLETAHRANQNIGQVFRYAVATGRAMADPTASLKGALPPHRPRNMPAVVDPAGVGELLRAIESYRGSPIVGLALRLAPLVFVRPGELRHAEWPEFDLAGGMWSIPASKMKMKRPHAVPLSRQAVAVLEELRKITGEGKYLFPGERTRTRPISDNTLNAALRRLGYSKDEMVAHGFRSIASTLLHEQGWDTNVIEAQLAHADQDEIRAAYNRAQYLAERKKMMQAWADYLDGLKNGAVVVPLFREAG
jgi:integrase